MPFLPFPKKTTSKSHPVTLPISKSHQSPPSDMKFQSDMAMAPSSM